MRTMPHKPHRTLRSMPVRRNLRLMALDGLLFSIMVGIGETYFAAFALAIGFSPVEAGLLASIPIVAGGSLQLISPWMVRRLGSHKRWVVICAHTQAVSLVPLVIGAVQGDMARWLVFFSVFVYWAAGLATGPAWNTWVGTLVPPPLRPRYFAHRMRLTHVGIVSGLVAGGLLLQAGVGTDRPVHLFALSFLVAGLARLASARCLAAQTEPVPLPTDQQRLRFRELWSFLRHTPGGQLLKYMLAVQVVLQISGPYFTPYMLRQLMLQYDTYMFLVSISFVTRVVSLPLLGRFAKRFGADKVLWIGGLGIVPLSFIWTLADSIPYLIAVQAVSGVLWGCYEMSTFLLLFETIPERDRTSVLTAYNFTNGIALVIGSVTGATILAALNTTPYAYYVLFDLSCIGRVAAVALLARFRPPTFSVIPVVLRTIAVRPADGTLERPVLPGMSPPIPPRANHSPSARPPHPASPLRHAAGADAATNHDTPRA